MKFPIPLYGAVERAVMRVLFALVVAHHIPGSLNYNTLPAPNGLARLADLTFLLNPAVFAVAQYLLYGALALYVLRVGWSFALPYMTLLSVCVGSIINSQGAISHYLQIVSLVLLAQTVAHFYNIVLPPAAEPSEIDAASESRVIQFSQQAIAATYLVSGLTKLIHTGGAWILQSPLVAVQIVKTTEQDYYDTLDAARAGSSIAIAEWMAQHPLIVGAVLTTGLLLELTAPLLLLGRRWTLFYGLALVAFHESVHRVMKLQFMYNEHLLWIYLVNVPFWAWLAARRLRRSTPEEVSHPRAAKVHNETN
ncbi:MAG: hypothetical protein H0W20_14475 [Chthoniobacterales bacterium]|nr:hypothetical protein [Chthoniobacterales bacterium]